MPEPTTPTPSTRVRLAGLAHDAALATAGVVDLDAGATGTFMTAGGPSRVPGVLAAVAPEGGYDVALRLVCALVPLPAVGDRVRDAVTGIAAEAGILVQRVTIDIVDVRDDAVAAAGTI